MHVSITFRHLEATEALKNHVEEKMEKLNKFLVHPTECHVILCVEKFRHQCEVTLKGGQLHLTALATDENMYASIDLAAHKLENQIRKHKEIMKQHKNHMSTQEFAASSMGVDGV